MFAHLVNLYESGTIILGEDISCDGLCLKSKVRIQTHIHDDHMKGFEESTTFQNIYMSPPSKDLLIAERNIDYDIRNNLFPVDMGEIIEEGNSRFRLLPSEHMLGAIQVEVELSCGTRLGYSGDFQWPLDQVIQVDALVLDSAIGNPYRKRMYTQEEADSKFLDLIKSKLIRGPIRIKGHRGTLQRALRILSGEINYPFLGSNAFIREMDVYRKHSYGVGCDILDPQEEQGKAAIDSGKYVRFYRTKGDRMPQYGFSEGTTIILRPYVSDTLEPGHEYTSGDVRFDMSDHANFDGALEYVKATGAKYVITDQTRGSEYAPDLATAIKYSLGIEAKPMPYD